MNVDFSVGLPIQIERVESYISQIEAPLAICSGNHDNCSEAEVLLADAAWLHNLRRPNLWIDDDRFSLGGYQFRVVPGQSTIPDFAEYEEI